MPNVQKVSPTDPFTMNCKMTYNDIAQIQTRVKRMWAAAQSERDFGTLQYLEDMLENIQTELRVRLDN